MPRNANQSNKLKGTKKEDLSPKCYAIQTPPPYPTSIITHYLSASLNPTHPKLNLRNIKQRLQLLDK